MACGTLRDDVEDDTKNTDSRADERVSEMKRRRKISMRHFQRRFKIFCSKKRRDFAKSSDASTSSGTTASCGQRHVRKSTSDADIVLGNW